MDTVEQVGWYSKSLQWMSQVGIVSGYSGWVWVRWVCIVNVCGGGGGN